jgi:hypothetical protein
MLTLGAILLCLGAGCAMIGAAYLFAVWMASLSQQPPRDWPTPLEGDLLRPPKFQNSERSDHAGLNSPQMEHVHAR